MSGSALVGHPPVSANDKLVLQGLLKTSPSLLEMIPHLAATGNYDSKANNMFIGGSFAISFAVIITSGRIWVRWKRRCLSTDDFVIALACLGCVAYFLVVFASQVVGCLGRHVYTCTYKELDEFYKLAHVNYSIFYFTVFLVKISIVLQNQRITGMTSRKWQIAHWSYLALLICLLPLSVFLNAFICKPVAAEYSFKVIGQVTDSSAIKCLNDDSIISLATRNLHIVTDWLLIPVPLIIIWRTQMTLTKKLRLMSMFVLGVVSSIASIIRNVLLLRETFDPSWDHYTTYEWDVVDILFAITVASLPTLNCVIDASIDRVRSWGSYSGSFLRGKFRTPGSSSYDLQNESFFMLSEGSGRPAMNTIRLKKLDSGQVLVEERPYQQNADVELQRPVSRFHEK